MIDSMEESVALGYTSDDRKTERISSRIFGALHETVLYENHASRLFELTDG